MSALKKKKRGHRLVGYLLLVTLVFAVVKIYPYVQPVVAEKFPVVAEKFPVVAATGPNKLYSEHAIMLSLDDGKVLFEKSSQERTYPASLTKMMTALLAIEELPDLQQAIGLTHADFNGLYEQGAALAGFRAGEEVRAVDLLYGTLLPSGAEAATALAHAVSGTEEAFVERMNDKAQELGMKHTHFTNSSGLQDTDHYTTVEDIALLLQYALHNDEFRTIFTTQRHSTQPTNLNETGMTVYNSMFERLESPSFGNGTILGGKTGYTDEAGLCLASLGTTLTGKEYIVVTTNAPGSGKTKPFHILDALRLYEKYAK